MSLSKQKRLVVKEGAILVDVRSDKEFRLVAFLGRSIPHQNIEKSQELLRLLGNDKSSPIIAFCAAGVRADKAKENSISWLH